MLGQQYPKLGKQMGLWQNWRLQKNCTLDRHVGHNHITYLHLGHKNRTMTLLLLAYNNT